jgi:hypothetical protein
VPRFAAAAAACLCILGLRGAGRAGANATPLLRIKPASAGRISVTVVRHVPRGRLDFLLDGRRVKRTRTHAVTFFLPRRPSDQRRVAPAWHELAIRRAGSAKVLALARFAIGASSSRSAPTLLLLGAPGPQTSGNSAVLRFAATTRALACSRDGLPFEPCASPKAYNGLAPGLHTFTIRARARHARRWSAITVSTTVPAPTPATPPSPPGRRLLFEDDFNGSTLDATSWSRYNSPGNAGHGLRRPSAITLDGQGHLVITAQMIDGRLVSGGMSNALNRAYGRFEFRVRTDPDPTGTMSGVVLTWPQSGHWPEDGENDIYETGALSGTRRPFGSFVHFGRTNEQSSFRHDADASQWHTMAMDWAPGYIRVYRDGALVWTLSNRGEIPHVPHHLCIQLDAVADHALTTPVRMYVDYVRIYE